MVVCLKICFYISLYLFASIIGSYLCLGLMVCILSMKRSILVSLLSSQLPQQAILIWFVFRLMRISGKVEGILAVFAPPHLSASYLFP